MSKIQTLGKTARHIIFSTREKYKNIRMEGDIYRLKDTQTNHPTAIYGLHLDSDFEKVEKNLWFYEAMRTWNNNQIFTSNTV